MWHVDRHAGAGRTRHLAQKYSAIRGVRGVEAKAEHRTVLYKLYLRFPSIQTFILGSFGQESKGRK